MTSPATDCTFCAALAEGSLVVVEESELVVGFMDAHPVAPGHALVMPRRHVESVAGLTEPEGQALWRMAQRLCGAIRAELAPAVNLHLSDGAEAEQDVFHVHLHVIPRHAGDAVRIELPGPRATRRERDAVADRLRGR